MYKKIFIFIFLFFLGFTTIDAKIIEIEKNDEVIYVEDDNGKFNYSWTFSSLDKTNLDLTINSESVNEEKISKLLKKDLKKEFVSFNYHGILPSIAAIKYPTKFSDGTRLNLYYYNDKTNKIEEIKKNIIVKNGYVSFEIEHCSDYFLSSSVVKDAEKNNSGGIVIIGMIIVIVSLIGFTLFRKK